MDDKEIEPLNQNFYITPTNTKTVDVYIIGQIKGPQYYQDSIHVIRTANPDDRVNIYINSPGGRLDTAVQFINAMAYCEAPIHIHIDDECISAATFIAMHGDEYSVNPHSRFMFHNYSGGAVGKGGEIYDNAVFMRAWIEKYYSDIYKDFLTTKEISDILEGKDLYMDSEQFVERIQTKKTNQMKLLETEENNPVNRLKDPELRDILNRLIELRFADIPEDFTAAEFIDWIQQKEKVEEPESEPKKSTSKRKTKST